MEHNVTMQTATWLVSRELAEAAGQWDVNMLSDDDGEYFCRVLLASDGIRFVPESKVYYRYFGYDTLGYIGRSHARIEAQWRSLQLHVNYLLAVEDGERARSACISYLQNWLVQFAPERPDIAKEMQELAETLGGELQAPRLGWKYSWIERLTGLKRARSVQLYLRKMKQSWQKSFDRVLFRFENRRLAGNVDV